MAAAEGRGPMPYRAPWWLPGGHLQTIHASLLADGGDADYRRERWSTPDGDFVDVDRVAGGDDTPLVVLFHGLEGSSRSHYALSLMRHVRQRGWRGAVPHFRGCSGEPNRLPRAYHSGDSTEIDWMLRRFRDEAGDAPLLAVGVSLGGNALLKWLGEQGGAAASVVRAAATVSAPLDLMAAGDALGRGFNLVYTRVFLSTLRKKSAAKLAQFPDLYDAHAVLHAGTLREFDNLVTAPLHGFRDTDDYWTRASSKPWLSRIEAPTLLINARNDPFLPGDALPLPAEVSSAVRCEFPEQGGHAGFVAGAFPGTIAWPSQRIISFFQDHI